MSSTAVRWQPLLQRLTLTTPLVASINQRRWGSSDKTTTTAAAVETNQALRSLVLFRLRLRLSCRRG